MANPDPPYTWATETNYPAGGFPWSAQPLAVAPSGDYFSPSPAAGSPVKLPAEYLNWLFAQTAKSLLQLEQNGNYAVADPAGLRALPIPLFNQTVFVPRGPGANVITSSDFASPIAPYITGFGGYYYWDPAYNVLDNACTAIRATANPAGPGMWRLQGGPLFTCTDLEYDDNLTSGGNPAGSPDTTAYQASPTIGTPQGFGRGPTPPTYFFTFNAGTALSIGVGKMYLGDVIDVSATVLVASVGGDVHGDLYWAWNNVRIGGSTTYLIATALTGASFTFRARYMVTAADITGGSATLGPIMSQLAGTGTPTGSLVDCHLTVRRP